MAWELVAIWIIVAAALVWYVRDVRRERLAKLAERARAYATQPQWHHREPAFSAPRPAPRQPDLAVQRRFLDEMQRLGQH